MGSIRIQVLLKIFCISVLSTSVLDKLAYSIPGRESYFSFECDVSDRQFHTVLQGQDGTNIPLLNWNDSSIYQGTPEEICVYSVQILTRILRENEGLINNLYLTYGRTGQEKVYICAVTGYESGCSPENYLFQLHESSGLEPQDALTNFTGRELTYLGNSKQDAQRQGFIDIQSWINGLSENSIWSDNQRLNSDVLTENKPRLNIETLAQQVTVRVITDSGVGSGTVLRRFENGYLVVTSSHVLPEPNLSIQVMTFDGSVYRAHRMSSSTLNEIDLAVLYFESEELYPEPTIHNASSYHLDTVYSTGFANWVYLSENSIHDARGSGLESYRFTTGDLSIVLAKPFSGGYMVGYSNRVEQGMSGGPVLDSNGNLIAINGRLQYPLQGINVYQFSDGTYPSLDLFSKMQALSWGIPASLLLPFLETISNG